MRTWTVKLRSSLAALSPRQIVMILVVGLVLGVFPLPGIPTFLCLFAAVGLRLNIPALQLLNNVTSPLQLILWLPLERIGARLCGSSLAPFRAPLGATALHAVLGWACVCLPAGVFLYLCARFLMHRYNGSGTHA
jgi:hypothetical protein